MAKRKAVRGSSRKPLAKRRSSTRRRVMAKKTASSRKIARKAAKKSAKKAKASCSQDLQGRGSTSEASRATARGCQEKDLDCSKERSGQSEGEGEGQGPSNQLGCPAGKAHGAQGSCSSRRAHRTRSESRAANDLRRGPHAAVATILTRSGSHGVRRAIGTTRTAGEVRRAH